ncbi:MAG: hypothetical protein J6X28_04875 [Bacilli bacterium]|nr:hypothetical protein [Bacilli bacterium]
MEEEEITKEIKNLKEIEEKEEIDEEKEEETTPEEEKKEEPPKEEKKEKKTNKKKIFLIAGISIGVILLIIILLIIFLPKKKEEKTVEKKITGSSFVTTIQSALEDGSLDDEIQRGLDLNGMKSDTVYLLSLDIDSDLDQELVVYAEEKEKKVLLSIEVDEEITYDDSFPLDAKDSLGYTYSSERAKSLWYTVHEKNYTIIDSAKKIIKEEDFLANYLSLTKNYHEKPVLDNAMEYKMNQKLDVKKLEKEGITIKKLLSDNNIKEEEEKNIYNQYVTDQEEAKRKEAEEAAEKARLEEEAKKLAGTLKLGSYSYPFGKYTITTPEGEEDGELVLYADLTCIMKGSACTYTVGEVRGTHDELTPGIALSTGNIYITTVDEGVLVEPATSNLVKHVG